MCSISEIIRTISLIGALAFVTLSPAARAVDPPPDGGYAGGNTAEGEDALFSLTPNILFNTAIGYHALYSNATGYNNTATGALALSNNTTGGSNTAIGSEALQTNTTGYFNTATGFSALFNNATGAANTANGFDALGLNRSGNSNTATGAATLFFNSTGRNNTANGAQALKNNTTGSNNIAEGFRAGDNLTTGDNNIDIGNPGIKDESNTIRIGRVGKQNNAYIAGISGVTVAGGVTVIVDTDGHLGSVVSSAQFKDAIKPMGETSEAVLSLKPVTFRYKHELDPSGIPQYGLVAEDVAQVDSDLVARDEKGKPYTVRYEAVNAMLLNEFLKEHRNGLEQDAAIAALKSTVGKQQAAIAQQQKEIRALVASVKEQASQIQKVSAEFAPGKAAPRVVAND